MSLTYTDTAVKLPAGAAARAWVHVAGNEPLVARRGVELPESFLRADRERQTNRAVITGIAMLALIGGVVIGAVFVTRRRTELVHDGTLSRGETIKLMSALALLAAVERFNALPDSLFSYDTSEPWTRFLGTTALSFVAVVPFVFFVFGIWLLLGALRRRVGIPMHADESSRSMFSDTVVAGLGLGSIVFISGAPPTLIPNKELPGPPSTLLDLAVPLLDKIGAIPSAAMMTVTAVGIPILVLLGVSQRRSIRLLLATLMVALLAVSVFASRSATELSVVQVVAFVVMIAIAVVALRPWGSLSAWSWIVAALTLRGLDGLRQTIHALTWQEHVAGALALAVVCALIYMIARKRKQTHQSAD